MEKCPKCSKNAVENDQCLACGIVVSRWLKLHSVAPPDRKEKPREKIVDPYSPPEKKEEPADNAKGLDLEPPSFLTEPDATVPINETGLNQILDDKPVASYIEHKDDPPAPPEGLPAPSVEPEQEEEDSRIARAAQPMGRVQPVEEPEEKDKKKPSFMGKTEAEVYELKKNLKTDWEEYYKQKKKRYVFTSREGQAEASFKVRNILISVLTIVICFLALDIGFVIRFGITTEYSTLQPVISLIAIAGFFIALSTMFTLKPSSVKIRTDEETKKVRIPLHFTQIIQLIVILVLIALVPMAERYDVDSKSEFPVVQKTDYELEYLTGEGIGNFYRPVLAPDGKTLFAIHLYGQDFGYIARLDGKGKYTTIAEGVQVTKFRFLDSERVVILSGVNLYMMPIDLRAGAAMDLLSNAVPILNRYKVYDFDVSPDGRHIVFCTEGEIFHSEMPFNTATNITKTPFMLETMPSFMPDGSGIIYIKDMLVAESRGDLMKKIDSTFNFAPGEQERKPHNFQIFTMDLISYESERITDDLYNYYHPLYSPDMKKIAVVAEVPDIHGTDVQALLVNERAVVLMRPDASAKLRVFPPLSEPYKAMHEMCWFKDDKTLLIGINALLQKGIWQLKFE